jgi:hypothetical protein
LVYTLRMRVYTPGLDMGHFRMHTENIQAALRNPFQSHSHGVACMQTAYIVRTY